MPLSGGTYLPKDLLNICRMKTAVLVVTGILEDASVLSDSCLTRHTLLGSITQAGRSASV
jgi:hypothetical protein